LVDRSTGSARQARRMLTRPGRAHIIYLQADARELKLTSDALGHQVRNVKANITQLVHNPLDVAAQKLLIPAALSIIRGLRAKREQS
jgi:Lhr-like helicase